jgi:hypothetical protein
MKNLAVLNLDYTSVTDKGLSSLAGLSRLTALRLDSATVTDAGIKTLESLDNLRTLNLYHTLVTEAGYRDLKAALPACRIIWERDSSLPTRRGS